jgi:hypothetical protein
MLSRLTEFLNNDGEKVWRKRNEEFEIAIQLRKRSDRKKDGGHIVTEAI